MRVFMRVRMCTPYTVTLNWKQEQKLEYVRRVATMKLPQLKCV